MAGRRVLYLLLLAAAAGFHYAYGQYVTHYILLFLLCAPLASVALSLPAAIRARTQLIGGPDVCRGRKTVMRLSVDSFGLLPPEAWSVTVSAENLFTGVAQSREKLRVYGKKRAETEFSPDTSEIGSIRYRIKRAFVYDYLGLIPIPIKRGAPAVVTVLPDKTAPNPEPELLKRSAMALKPKPMGFSEEHEMRPYRRGDPMNLIHWKLTAKYDGIIVREPQEEIRKPIVLVPDMPVLYREHRSVLEQLCYLNAQLMEEQVPYTLQYGKKRIVVRSENDFDDFIKAVLSEPMQREKPVLSSHVTEDALIYRIKPGRGVGL